MDWTLSVAASSVLLFFPLNLPNRLVVEFYLLRLFCGHSPVALQRDVASIAPESLEVYLMA